MPAYSLGQILVLLFAAVLVIALARRLGLPVILGYLIVGILVGPHVLGVLPNGPQTRAMGEIGVVFLLFTLGLEFSYARMVAMRREVFGLGSAQTLVVGGAWTVAAHAAGVGWAAAIVVGGALTTCSTAIVLQQLGEQDELNRTHGRVSFAVLLFQDLAFVPLLALATVLAQGPQGSGAALLVRLVVLGLIALGAVLVIGRWIVRPLLYEIAHSRLRELFTLAALLIVLAAAWTTERLGLSMALGAFLAGMMLAESEYRHQIEAAIRPFRELLLGLFFISVGMLLDLRVLGANLPVVLGLLGLLVLGKALLSTLTVAAFGNARFKSLRTGLVLAGGGEFGVALLTILTAGGGLVAPRLAQSAAGRGGAGHDRQPDDHPLQQAHRTLRAARAWSAGSRHRARVRRCHRAGAARTRAAVRFRPRRAASRAGAGLAGLRIPGARSGSGQRAGRARGRRAGGLGRQCRRGAAAQSRTGSGHGGDHHVCQSGVGDRRSCARCAVCARMCRCWCAPRMIRGERICSLAGATEVVPETFEAESDAGVAGPDAAAAAGDAGTADHRHAAPPALRHAACPGGKSRRGAAGR